MKTALLATAAALAVAACGSTPMPMGTSSAPAFSQDGLPDGVRVPAGHRVKLETVGVGDLSYECREKAGGAGSYEWTFAGPMAVLNDRSGKPVGRYYGPPATWEAADGSKITGTQLAVAPAGAGNIPLQLVKADPAVGSGAMSGVSYVQRVAIKGGAAPSTVACDANARGKRETVKYQADYIFWSAV